MIYIDLELKYLEVFPSDPWRSRPIIVAVDDLIANGVSVFVWPQLFACG